MFGKLIAVVLLVMALATEAATTQNKKNPGTAFLLKETHYRVIELAIKYNGGHGIHNIFQVVNVGTGKCLVSQKGISGTNDAAVLKDCSNKVSQMYTGPGIVQCCNHEELVLSIPLAVSHGTVRRLSINLDKKIIFCSREESKACKETAVQIHRVSDGSGEVFVLEVGFGWYMKSDEDGINVELTSDGTSNDKATRWKLVELVKGANDPDKNSDRECKPEMVQSGNSGFEEKSREKAIQANLLVAAGKFKI